MEKQSSDANANTLGEDNAICQTIEEVEPRHQDNTADNTDGKAQTKLDIIYSIEDTPPWYLCLMLGFQHYLTMFGSTITQPLILAPALCITDGVHTSEVISTCFFVSGMVTLIQVTFGVRLPIIQGGTFTFLVPAFAILNLPKWKCSDADTANITMGNWTNTTESPEGGGDSREEWTARMCEIQGAIIVASLFQVLIGFSGVIGLILQYIGPIVIAPTISLIGLSLFGAASNFCQSNWWIAIMTMVFIIAFSQYLRNVEVPCCSIKQKKCGCTRSALLKLFPIILAIVVSWVICAILTVSNAIPDDPHHWAYGGRTDNKTYVLREAQWFRVPYPGQWGLPTVSAAAVFGMLSGVLAGMIESIGDYYACARLSGAPPPPVHAINRGVLVEGFGCLLAGLWGSGTGTTSYSENVGAIGITKVGSRRVILYGAGLMMVFGTLGKFGALFVTIPDPIVGGVFMTMFGMLTAVGISNLQFVDLNSSRNLFIFGFSIFFGLTLPLWVSSNAGVVQTGNTAIDQILTVLLSTSTFVGGAVAFVLDNTVPGTDEERGLTIWHQHILSPGDSKSASDTCYDLPFGMSKIREWNWPKYVPICPTFTGFRCRKSKYDVQATQDDDTRGARDSLMAQDKGDATTEV